MDNSAHRFTLALSPVTTFAQRNMFVDALKPSKITKEIQALISKRFFAYFTHVETGTTHPFLKVFYMKTFLNFPRFLQIWAVCKLGLSAN